MRVETWRPNLYVTIGDAYDSNSTVIISRGEAFLIDTMGSRKDAEQLKHFIEKELAARVRFILCTHYFSDHLAALKLFPETSILAHRNYRYTFDRERNRTDEEKSFFVEPSILVTDELSIRWGDYSLDIFYNPGHTMCTLNVDIPEADLIHVGDTIVGNIIYIAYSTPPLFPPALERIRRRRRNNLLASHGSTRSTDALSYAGHYLDSLQRKTTGLYEVERAVQEITLNSCLPEGIAGTPFETIFHKRNVRCLVEATV